MTYPDLSIGQRLAIGFGLVFVIVAALLAAVFTWHTDSARAQTEYTERTAPMIAQIHELERSIYRVGILLRSTLLERDAQRLNAYQASVTRAEAALDRLASLQMEPDGAEAFARTSNATSAYLAQAAFVLEGAATGTMEPGDEIKLSSLREAVTRELEEFVALKEGKATAALSRIAELRQQTARGLTTSAVIVGIVLALLAWLTARSVSNPTRRLLTTAASLEAGDWKPALSLAPRDNGTLRPRPVRDEMTRLSNALGSAAVALEYREQRLSAEGRVARAVASTLDRSELADSALKNIIQHVGAELGVVYWAQRTKDTLFPVASYALGGSLDPVHIGDGIPGQAAQERRSIFVSDIPADTAFKVKIGYDQAVPKSIAAIPLVFGEKLKGVLLLGSLRAFSADAHAFLEACATQLGIGMQNAAAYEEIQTLLRDLSERNERIQAQNEELQIQNEEIQAQNEEIQAQSQQLQVQHEEMQAQNEELLQQSEELRHHTAQLAEADERKNKFLGVLAHELRNPMAPISNSIFILKRSAPGSESALRAQAVIERQAAHLVRLIDDLLDVTRISEGKIHIHRERLDFVDVARTCVEDLSVAFEQQAIALDLDLPNEAVDIHGDRTRLCQVLDNLLNNSLKFCDRGGKVSLSLRLDHSSGDAVLRVWDNGIGMESEFLPKLFQPFSQGISGLARTKGGLGLGLALVKALVQLHEGSVHARSEGPGRGAEFTVRIPLASAGAELRREHRLAASHSQQAIVHPHVPQHVERAKILIIEDNIDAARTLSEALQMEGYEVALALSGTEGVQRAKTFKPDVVLCDIGLPGLDGYEVARELRADPALKDAILIALTGYASAPDKEQASSAGFDLHLAKPLRLADLTHVIAKLSREEGEPN